MPLNPILVTLPELGRFGASLRRVFPEDMLRRIAARYAEIAWHDAQRAFYRQREENLTAHPAFSDIFDLGTRARIAGLVGQFFGADVDPEFDIAAHKMVRGDYIAPHTDENAGGERYRLTVTLNPGWRREEGGILLVLADGDVRSIIDAWLPTWNNGFLFRIGERSFHAVTPVTSDRARLSLILTFKDRAPSTGARAEWYPFPWEADLEEAAHTAGVMGIAGPTFSAPYRPVRFASAERLREDLGGLDNAPPTLSYTTCAARNVDEAGQQPKGSDAARIAALERRLRLPLITIVRRRDGGHVLVNGSHRLSLAADRRWPVAATIFGEA